MSEKIYIKNTDVETIKNLADFLVDKISSMLKNQDHLNLFLPGGLTPSGLYELFSSQKYQEKINWNKINIFIGDERFVPFDDEKNNANFIYKKLINKIKIPKENINIIKTENVSPEESANFYENILLKLKTIDIIILGIGEDAHTLSLFPGYENIIFEDKRLCKSFYLKEQKMYRVTITKELVKKSSNVIFLSFGSSKSIAIKNIFKEEYNPIKYPAQIIKKISKNTYWFLDKLASKYINSID